MTNVYIKYNIIKAPITDVNVLVRTGCPHFSMSESFMFYIPT